MGVGHGRAFPVAVGHVCAVQELLMSARLAAGGRAGAELALTAPAPSQIARSEHVSVMPLLWRLESLTPLPRRISGQQVESVWVSSSIRRGGEM
jgi:hypothetical protein